MPPGAPIMPIESSVRPRSPTSAIGATPLATMPVGSTDDQPHLGPVAFFGGRAPSRNAPMPPIMSGNERYVPYYALTRPFVGISPILAFAIGSSASVSFDAGSNAASSCAGAQPRQRSTKSCEPLIAHVQLSLVAVAAVVPNDGIIAGVASDSPSAPC